MALTDDMTTNLGLPRSYSFQLPAAAAREMRVESLELVPLHVRSSLHVSNENIVASSLPEVWGKRRSLGTTTHTTVSDVGLTSEERNLAFGFLW